MTGQNAGERKRTVTVVVGPKTEDLMNRLNAVLGERVPWKETQQLTGLAGAALNHALTEWAKLEWPEETTLPVSHFD